MNFFDIIMISFLEGPLTLSLGIFVISTLLLFVGITSMVWMKAVNIKHIEAKPLKWIEYTHPHIPSYRIIVAIVLSSITLTAVALQTVQGVAPFTDPYQGLNIVSLFILGTALGILGELQWKGAGEYAAAFLLGTAIAFLLFVIVGPDQASSEAFSLESRLLTLVFGSLFLGGYAIAGRERTPLVLTSICAFVIWVSIYMV